MLEALGSSNLSGVSSFHGKNFGLFPIVYCPKNMIDIQHTPKAKINKENIKNTPEKGLKLLKSRQHKKKQEKPDI